MPYNIRLTPNYKLPKDTGIVGLDNVFTINKAKFMKSKRAYATENANTCTMIGLTAGEDKGFLMHLAPEQQSLHTIKSGLEKCVQKLRDNLKNIDSDIFGILVGGRNSECKESFNLFDTVAKTLDEMGIPISMICGKWNNVANDNMAIAGNTVTIWNESFRDLHIPEKPTQSQLEDVLNKNYQVVDINPDDTLRFMA